MSESVNLDDETKQPVVKKVKLYHATRSSDSSQDVEEENVLQKKRERRSRESNREKRKHRDGVRRQRQENTEILESSNSNIDFIEITCEPIIDDRISTNSLSVAALQESQNLFVEVTKRFRINDSKRKRQQRYREKNRERLKQRRAEIRKSKLNFQITADSSTSSNTNGLELNNGETIDANPRNCGLDGTQQSPENERSEEKNALQKKRERQQRYRERNRDKLKQREAERRQRQQNIEIVETSNWNIDYIEITCEPIIDEIST